MSGRGLIKRRNSLGQAKVERLSEGCNGLGQVKAEHFWDGL